MTIKEIKSVIGPIIVLIMGLALIIPIINNDAQAATNNRFILKKKVSGYVVWWDKQNGLYTIQKNKNKISQIKIFWYNVKQNHDINRENFQDIAVRRYAHQNNIKVLAAISNNSDADLLTDILNNPQIQTYHLKKIINLVTKYHYDGVEIDYEGLNGLAVRDQFSVFIERLAQSMHRRGKILSVAVHAKTNDEGSWDGPAAQDWHRLGRAADEIMVMAYDHHWSTSEAGDIAPVSWTKAVLNYAVSVVPRKKIRLGIHFYGYDWVKKDADSLTYSDVKTLANQYHPSILMSPEKERYFTYTKDHKTHTVYYTNYQVVKPRIKLANDYKIGGISIWRLGQEDSRNWAAIYRAFH